MGLDQALALEAATSTPGSRYHCHLLLVIFLSQTPADDVAFSLNLSFVENVYFRNATLLRSGATLATTMTTSAGTETTASSRFLLTNSLQRYLF